MKLVISYQPAKFQIPQLSELIFTEVFIRHLKNHDDVNSQCLALKIAHFVEPGENKAMRVNLPLCWY